MLGDKAGSMTLQETSKPIDSGRYGLPAMETSTVGGGKLLGHDVQTQATFTAHMRPDGSWLGHAHAGVIFCAEGCLGPLKLCQYLLTNGVAKNGTETVFG